MNNGWIKLHRKFIKWGWYQKSEMVHLFLHFLLLANHEENEWQGNKINKGQFITGLGKLKQDTGISAQTLRTCIDRLKSTGEITNKSTNKFRLITIVNWEDYQNTNKKLTSKSTSKLTNNQQTTNKQLTANNKLKNIKNDKEDKEEGSSFEVFWSKYPKKLSKEITRKTFLKLKPNETLLNEILDSLEKHKKTEQWIKDKGQFIPYPATWLNQKRWEDEVEIKNEPKRFNCNNK